MNFRYVPDDNRTLKEAVARNPTASLHEISQSHPTLARMSLDHLALRLAEVQRHAAFKANSL